MSTPKSSVTPGSLEPTMRSQRRQRRSTDEIRTLLLDAARELFAKNGYEATTTRDICARSGVAQQQLFDNFGSKEGIFEAAFMAPLVDLVDHYIAAFGSAAPESTIEERVAMLVDGLYDLATDNRRVLLTAVCRSSQSTDPDAGPSSLLDHIARTLHEMVAITAPPAGIDVPAAVVSAAGMVFGVILLEDMLYPSGSERFGRERLTREMVALLVHGGLHREIGDTRSP